MMLSLYDNILGGRSAFSFIPVEDPTSLILYYRTQSAKVTVFLKHTIPVLVDMESI